MYHEEEHTKCLIYNVARLVQYGLESGLIPEEERIYSTNQILEVMKKDDYEAPTAEEVGTEIDLAEYLKPPAG